MKLAFEGTGFATLSLITFTIAEISFVNLVPLDDFLIACFIWNSLVLLSCFERADVTSNGGFMLMLADKKCIGLFSHVEGCKVEK